jgi:hypothetical protein
MSTCAELEQRRGRAPLRQELARSEQAQDLAGGFGARAPLTKASMLLLNTR